MTPTQRSLAYLRGGGYTVGIVEHWNAFARLTLDLWGFADLVAFRPGVPVLLVQTTTGANLAARRRKILANETARQWVQAGHEIVLHSWSLRGKRGARKVWTNEPEWLTADMFRKGEPT
jgi:hypothetical protein